MGCDGNEYIDYVRLLGATDPGTCTARCGWKASARRQETEPASAASTSSKPHLAGDRYVRHFLHRKDSFVRSGTEATMSAIRLARAYTKRKYIVKFEGCYHGHADALLVSKQVQVWLR